MPWNQGGGAGRGRGAGQGRGRMGGRMGGNQFGAGPGGYCICPSCGTRVPHMRGVPCFQQKCPECGTPMVRE